MVDVARLDGKVEDALDALLRAHFDLKCYLALRSTAEAGRAHKSLRLNGQDWREYWPSSE